MMTRFHSEMARGVDGALLLTDDGGRVLLANDRASLLFGRDLTGRSLLEETLDDDTPMIASLGECFRRASSGTDTSRDLIVADNGDGPRFFRVSISRVAGDGSGRVAAIIDITDSLRGSPALQKIFSQVSHDIRSPLTSVSGAAELLQSGRVGALDAMQSRLVAIVLDGVGKIEEILKRTKTMLAQDQVAAGAGDRGEPG